MSPKSTKEEVVVSEPVPEIESNEKKALKIVRRYSLWSMGFGIIPVVGLDLAAIFGAQLKMLSEMSKTYGVEFKENRAKNIIGSLIASLGIIPLGTGLLFSGIKMIPGLGNWASRIALPITAGAVTYATGKVFIAHFESGGNFLNLNAAKMKAAYQRAYAEGKAVLAKPAPAVA